MIDPRLLQLLMLGKAGALPQGMGFLDPAQSGGMLGKGAAPLLPMSRTGPPAVQPGFMQKLLHGPAPLSAALSLGISGLTGELQDDTGGAIGGALGAGVGGHFGTAGGAKLGAMLGAPFGGPVGSAVGGTIGATLGALGGKEIGSALGGGSKAEKKRKKIEEEIERKRALQQMLQNLQSSAAYLGQTNQLRSRYM